MPDVSPPAVEIRSCSTKRRPRSSCTFGIVKFKYDWDPEGAEFYLRRAIERNPSLYEAYLWRSQVAEGLVARGRMDSLHSPFGRLWHLSPLTRLG
jgi:hypothetical protein